MTIAEIMAALNCSRRHVYNLIQRGELRPAPLPPTFRKGARVRIPAEQVERLLRVGT